MSDGIADVLERLADWADEPTEHEPPDTDRLRLLAGILREGRDVFAALTAEIDGEGLTP